jgi:hypothetical protein
MQGLVQGWRWASILEMEAITTIFRLDFLPGSGTHPGVKLRLCISAALCIQSISLTARLGEALFLHLATNLRSICGDIIHMI